MRVLKAIVVMAILTLISIFLHESVHVVQVWADPNLDFHSMHFFEPNDIQRGVLARVRHVRDADYTPNLDVMELHAYLVQTIFLYTASTQFIWNRWRREDELKRKDRWSRPLAENVYPSS